MRGMFPTAEFSEIPGVFLHAAQLAQVGAVVADEGNDRIVSHAELFDVLEHPADPVVAEADLGGVEVLEDRVVGFEMSLF